ncbi:MAG: ABC transporter permease [Parvularculales bacterium]
MSAQDKNPSISEDNSQDLKAYFTKIHRRARLRTFFLTVPLLIFVLVGFIVPITLIMTRSVHNATFPDHFPRTTEALRTWSPPALPNEAAWRALGEDLWKSGQEKTTGKVATRLNYELPGARSLFTSAARKAKQMGSAPTRETIISWDERWADPTTWIAMKKTSHAYTPDFYLSAVDARQDIDGNITLKDEDYRIYVPLFVRTFGISALITGLCLVLGFPVAYWLANMPLRRSNILMICVLLPFWTSLLVRTTSWIVLLQSEGVLNDILVSTGLIDDMNRIQMIYNATGTVVAMTHILLPFMILPLYSIMRTIPPHYMRAARSLGASQPVAFLKVYMPQAAPGVSAGVLLVFILAIGYYITPALVGGQSGELISGQIAFHIQRSLNWSLGAAISVILLTAVFILYYLYNRLAGAENVRLG